MEVCFLVDVTKYLIWCILSSMEPYKLEAKMCIDRSMTIIKEKTNRDVLWSAIGY